MTRRRYTTRPLARHARRAFTLIEVLLVLVILGMLATVAIVALSGTREGARIDTTKLLVKQIESALETYNMHMGQYPTTDQGLAALLTKPSFDDPKMGDKWRGPYLKEEPRDPWGNAIHYEKVEGSTDETAGKPYKVWSNGPDGQDGTEDNIKNWSDSSSGSGGGSGGK